MIKVRENKEDMYVLLSSYLREQSLSYDRHLYITQNSEVFYNKGVSPFSACNHIEADTRVVLFVLHSCSVRPDRKF